MFELEVWQAPITDNQGNILPGAQITVFNSDDTVATIYDDLDRTPRSNPFTVGTDALARFYAEPGRYRVQAQSGTDIAVYDNVDLSQKAARNDLASPESDVLIAGIPARNRVISADSIQALRDLPAAARRADVTVLVKGYYSGSDLGGGQFYFDLARVAEDDGGSVIDGWVRIIDNETIYAEDFGVSESGDATSKLKDLAAFSDSKNVVFLRDMSILITETISFEKAKSIDFNDLTVNYSSNNFIFSDTSVIIVGSSTQEELHTLTEQLDISTKSIPSIGASTGDMLSIWSPVDGSWSGHRPTYRKGEYAFVGRGDEVETVFEQGLIDTYPAGSKIFRLQKTKCDIKGKVKFVNAGDYIPTFALLASQLVSSDFTGLTVDAYELTHGFSLYRCAGCSGSSVRMRQKSQALLGLEYGLAVMSCQDIRLSGAFHSERHGSSSGTRGRNGDAINRGIHIRGSVTTSGAGSVMAADFHGNTEHSSYGGYLEGLVTGGHNTWTEKGTVITNPYNGSAFALQISEAKSFSHSFSGAKIKSNGTGTNRGAVEAGGGGAPFSENTTIGGTLDFSFCEIDDPVTTVGAFYIRNRGSLVGWDVDMSGVSINTPNANNSIKVLALTGSEAGSLNFQGSESWKSGVDVSPSTDLAGVTQSGEFTINVDTSSSWFSKTVLFPSPFPRNRVTVSITKNKSFAIGSTFYSEHFQNRGAPEFNYIVASTDKSNFSKSDTIIVYYKAECS